jgi:hypothetical protein
LLDATILRRTTSKRKKINRKKNMENKPVLYQDNEMQEK